MIGWVRPQILIPAHGEPLHMAAHAALARRAGVPKVITCRDGDLVRLAPQPGIIDQLPAGRLYKDGSLLIGAQERTVPDRRRLGFAGIVSVALTLSLKGELVSGPRCELSGIPDTNVTGTPLLQIAHDSVVEAFNSMPKPRRRDPDAVAEALRRAVRSAIGAAWKKKPICHVHVLTV
jgi:ribonuclease J